MKHFNEWLEDLKTVHLPNYKELPPIALYSDQVLDYVNTVLAPLFGSDQAVLTNTMINNYVKLKMMPAPEKKRYNKDHIAHILTITILKQVISIPNIVAGIARVREEFGKEAAYNNFIKFIEEGIQQILAQTFAFPSISLKEENVDSTLVPMKAASIAFAAKLVAERSLENIMERNIENE